MVDIKISDWVKPLKELAKFVYFNRQQIKRIDNLPSDCKRLLKNLVLHNKQTFHIYQNKSEDKRIKAHFQLEENKDGYVSFPNYVWDKLKKRYNHKQKNMKKRI